MEKVSAGSINRMKILFLSYETNRTDLLSLYVLFDILEFIKFIWIVRVFLERIIVIIRLKQSNLSQVLLSLPNVSQFNLEASQSKQVVLSSDVIMQKLNKDEQSYDEMNCKQDSQIERHAQYLALKTVERMICRFSPEQKGQKQIAHLYNYDQSNELFNPRIVLYYIYFWKQSTQKMLNTLSQVQDAKIQVEAHTTRLAYENPAKNK